MRPGSRETDRLLSKDMGEESKQWRLALANLSHQCCQLAMTFPKLRGKAEVEEKLCLASTHPARV